MELLTFGETTEININEAYQDVLFAGKRIGFIHYKAKSLLAPVEEYFWSDLLTKKQAKAVSSRSTRIDDAEDNGYYQAFLHLNPQKKYADLYVLAKAIYYEKRKTDSE